MSVVADRVRALIARALDLSGTSEDERRTSAVIAVRLIDQHNMLGAPREPEVKYVYVDREPQGPRWRVIASKYSGRCQACGTSYAVGQSIAWASGAGALCLGCHRGRAAA